MKILVFCAKGFETMEFSAFIELLKRLIGFDKMIIVKHAMGY